MPSRKQKSPPLLGASLFVLIQKAASGDILELGSRVQPVAVAGLILQDDGHLPLVARMGGLL